MALIATKVECRRCGYMTDVGLPAEYDDDTGEYIAHCPTCEGQSLEPIWGEWKPRPVTPTEQTEELTRKNEELTNELAKVRNENARLRSELAQAREPAKETPKAAPPKRGPGRPRKDEETKPRLVGSPPEVP